MLCLNSDILVINATGVSLMFRFCKSVCKIQFGVNPFRSCPRAYNSSYNYTPPPLESVYYRFTYFENVLAVFVNYIQDNTFVVFPNSHKFSVKC